MEKYIDKNTLLSKIDFNDYIGCKLLTVTLLPSLYNKRCRTQFKLTSDKLDSILKVNCVQFVKIPEITPQRGNIHYHVMIRAISDQDEAVLYDCFKNSRYFGNSYINKKPFSNIDEVKRTLEYLLKEHDKTKYVINKGNLNEILDIIYMYKGEPQTHDKYIGLNVLDFIELIDI